MRTSRSLGEAWRMLTSNGIPWAEPSVARSIPRWNFPDVTVYFSGRLRGFVVVDLASGRINDASNEDLRRLFRGDMGVMSCDS